MNLIFIYGPPAVGKLTVANELAKITGYRIFHNHHTVDLISSIFEFGTKSFSKLNREIRLSIFEEASKNRLDGMIFTFVYEQTLPSDQEFVKKVVKIVEKYKGKVYFVQLCCSYRELSKRVKEGSRKNFRKIKTKKRLKAFLNRTNAVTSIPFVDSFFIDNTKTTPKKVARMIMEHYGL
ncbi:MAG: AAA family ATPase [bacterium]